MHLRRPDAEALPERARLEPGSLVGGCRCGPGEMLVPQTKETAAAREKGASPRSECLQPALPLSLQS